MSTDDLILLNFADLFSVSPAMMTIWMSYMCAVEEFDVFNDRNRRWNMFDDFYDMNRLDDFDNLWFFIPATMIFAARRHGCNYKEQSEGRYQSFHVFYTIFVSKLCCTNK
ncbi:hypothetical protein X975_07710, partial [Stegodyphus mimosarum]